MKVHVSSVVEIKSTKMIPSGAFVQLAKGIAGKKASIDIASSSTVGDLINAAKSALAIDSSIVFADIFVKLADKELDVAKTLELNKVIEGSMLKIHFKRVVS